MASDRTRIAHKRDRLRQLRAFCHAARLGSLSKAGEHLGMSQAAVSLQVRELEHELEAVLFDRAGPGVRLTGAGEQFFAHAGPLVEGMEGLLKDFAEQLESNVSGRLELAASAAGAAIVLPPYVRRYRERYPDVRVWVRNCTLREGLELLRDRSVELLLGPSEPLEGYAVEYREMLTYDIVLITSRDHPLAGRETVTPQEAAKWPVVVPPAGSYSLQFGETAASRFGVEGKSFLEVGGWGVIKRYVERGIGICLAPSISIHPTDQLSVIPLKEYFPARSFGVYTVRGRALTAPAQRLLGLLIPGLAQQRGSGA